jgi:hypothetical protein
LVGDNPFNNISHLSQERTRLREKATLLPERAADLIHLAVENGANGFMFSVSETTLSILKALKRRGALEGLSLYGIVPYAYEYVKLATQVGGISGLAKRVGGRIIGSGNLRGMAMGVVGFLNMNPLAIMKTYMTYEISRIRSAAGKEAKIDCILFHEVITDLALALKMEWLFKSYIGYMGNLGITPGFNTCNFAYLVSKFRDWEIDLSEVVIAAPFNKVGFQMAPCKEECEQALKVFSKPSVIAISIFAGGYLAPSDAIEYISALPKIKGVATGVSKERHAKETFEMLKKALK